MRVGKWFIDFEDFVIELGGLLAHGSLPIITLMLGKEFIIPVTLMYLAYQIIDFYNGENPKEVQGDIVEYLIGLLIGALLLKI